jgi:hypothetical protein
MKERIKLDDFLNEIRKVIPIDENVSNADESFIKEIIYNANNFMNELEDFPFTFIENVSRRSEDTDGWYSHYIFQRKSDEKYFHYTMYDGRIEERELWETKLIIIEKWDV